MKRDSWGSRLGFIFAVAGSAVGLANIWRFPFLVGQNGGAAFVLLYLICLMLIGFPVFISELLIGRTAQMSPGGAFQKLTKSQGWGNAGKLTILTGFIVSSFYSAVAGWILGYLIEAIKGNISHFESTHAAANHYESLMINPIWGLSFHFCFLALCISVLFFGVRNGIERGNKIMMPLLFVVLATLVIYGLSTENAMNGLHYLFSPDWNEITPTAILIAMGQSFFTLSIGQGTLVTYGSYLQKQENLIKSSFPIVLMDTFVSLFAAIAVFTIVFSVGMEPNSGPGLIFHTLPYAFSQMTGGYFLAILFFLLVMLAAMTSEISALEPSIAYLIDEHGWKRKKAVFVVGLSAFIIGIPSALSYSVLHDSTFFGLNFLELMDFTASAVLIPLGGFLAIILTGWVWGFKEAIMHLKQGAAGLFERKPWLTGYFKVCIKYLSPILILFVFLNALGVFS